MGTAVPKRLQKGTRESRDQKPKCLEQVGSTTNDRWLGCKTVVGEGLQGPQEIIFCSKGAAGGSILPKLENFSRKAEEEEEELH